MIPAILAAIFLVAVIIALGWLASALGVINNAHAETFVVYILHFAVPALLFTITATANLHTLFDGPAILAFAIGIMGMFAVGYIVHAVAFGRSSKQAKQGAFVCSFPDMVFIGIPVITMLVGQDRLVSVATGNVITSILLIPLTIVLLELQSGSGRSVASLIMANIFTVLCKSQVVAPIFKILLSGPGFKLPDMVNHTLKLLMDNTTGVSLFALGSGPVAELILGDCEPG